MRGIQFALRDREQGQTLALIVLSLAVLMGIVALAVDVGSIVVTKQREQSAADAAVLAAIGVIYDGGSTSAAVAEAHTYASDNGYATGVTVNIPPTQGDYVGDTNAVEVVIEGEVSPIFGGALGLGPWHLSARAVGSVVGKPYGYGVITLHPTNCQSLTVGSGSSIDVTGGGIYVNSTCTSGHMAMQAGSSAILTADEVKVAGDVELSGSAVITPSPDTRSLPIPDPWADLVPPSPNLALMSDQTPADCRVKGATTFQPGLYNCAPLQIEADGDVTFLDGDYVFRGGIEFKPKGKVTFGRGVYYIMGGGFRMASNAIAVNTDGMLIYNSCDGSCGGDDWFQMASGSSLDAEPYGGAYGNLLVWQDKANTQQVDFNSNSTVRTGAGTGVYAPKATIEYDCGSTVPLQFVALNVHIGSNARIVVDATHLPQASVWSVGLVE